MNIEMIVFIIELWLIFSIIIVWKRLEFNLITIFTWRHINKNDLLLLSFTN